MLSNDEQRCLSLDSMAATIFSSICEPFSAATIFSFARAEVSELCIQGASARVSCDTVGNTHTETLAAPCRALPDRLRGVLELIPKV